MKKMKTKTGWMVLSLVILSSCGTTRYFHVKSDPEGALLLKADKGLIEYIKPAPLQTPENEKTTFMFKKDEFLFIAMKRGFYADTVTVNRESPADITFRLKRIENVSPELPPVPDILKDRALLLPVDAEFVWHKGVGALDKYEIDEKQSALCAAELTRILTGNDAMKPVQFPDALAAGWTKQNENLKKRLLSLNTMYFNFYPKPVVINETVDAGFLQTITDRFNASDEKYLMFIHCKSIRPTGGRIAGNIVTQAVGPGITNQNPSAFAMHNSTLACVYIIHPKTWEVVDFRQTVTSYDIYKTEQIEKLAGEILALLEKKN